MINFLDQDLDNGQFLSDSRYATWAAASSSPRGSRGMITVLFKKNAESPAHLRDDDVTDAQAEAVAIKNDPGMVGGQNSFARMTVDEKRDFKAELVGRRLETRNRQLTKMLQVLSSYVDDNDAEDVVEHSTSLEWIWRRIQARYNIETKGVNFLKIVKHRFKAGENPQTFYKKFRSAFIDNLRKKGDSRNHLTPGDVMEEDETMSPSQEDTIVLWSLDQMDRRLPEMVARMYEHRLDKTTHLIDLAPSIFQQVPMMLETLDREANLAAMASSAAVQLREFEEEQTLTMDAFFPSRGGGRNYVAGRGRGAGSAPATRGRGSYRGGYPRISPVTGRPWTVKMCRLCEEKHKSPAVVASHNTAECDSISRSEKRGMLAALQAMDLHATNDEDYSDLIGAGSDGFGDAAAVQEGLAQGLQNESS